MSTHHSGAAPAAAGRPRAKGRAHSATGKTPHTPAGPLPERAAILAIPHAHHNARRLARRAHWGRWLASAAVALLLLSTLVWLTRQSPATTNAQDLVGRAAPAATLPLASSLCRVARR